MIGFNTVPAAPDGVRPDFGPLLGAVGAGSGLLLLFGACLSWSSPDLCKKNIIRFRLRKRWRRHREKKRLGGMAP